MTKLLIEPLKTIALEQEFEIKHQRVVNAIRMKLLKFGSPSGSLKLAILEGVTERASASIPVSEIESQINSKYPGGPWAHFHGMIKFEFANDIMLQHGTKYTLKLSGIAGYAFSEAAYIGGIKEHEFPKNTFDDSLLLDDELKPYGFELWAYKKEQYQ